MARYARATARAIRAGAISLPLSPARLWVGSRRLPARGGGRDGPGQARQSAADPGLGDHPVGADDDGQRGVGRQSPQASGLAGGEGTGFADGEPNAEPVGWFAVCLAAELASFTCNFALQRLALRTRSWFPVVTAGLTGNAVTSSLPGGSAVGAAVQFHLLTTAGFDTDTSVGGLTAFSLLEVGGLLALPIVALPAILAGVPVSRGLVNTALLGIAAFVLYALFGVIVLRADWPLAAVGRVAQRVWNRVTRGHRQPVSGLDKRLLDERDTIRAVLGKNWRQAVVLTVGRLGADYACLLAALRATGAEPQPSLVLLAYSAAGIIALFPITPGGLGIVEASLSGLLVLAGVRAGYAVLAILAYRIASYWLPLLAGPVAYLLFCHRYGRPVPRQATPGESSSHA
jgi:uncharacterized protein (TIRG00374 family)